MGASLIFTEVISTAEPLARVGFKTESGPYMVNVFVLWTVRFACDIWHVTQYSITLYRAKIRAVRGQRKIMISVPESSSILFTVKPTQKLRIICFAVIITSICSSEPWVPQVTVMTPKQCYQESFW